MGRYDKRYHWYAYTGPALLYDGGTWAAEVVDQERLRRTVVRNERPYDRGRQLAPAEPLVYPRRGRVHSSQEQRIAAGVREYLDRPAAQVGRQAAPSGLGRRRHLAEAAELGQRVV